MSLMDVDRNFHRPSPLSRPDIIVSPTSSTNETPPIESRLANHDHFSSSPFLQQTKQAHFPSPLQTPSDSFYPLRSATPVCSQLTPPRVTAPAPSVATSAGRLLRNSSGDANKQEEAFPEEAGAVQHEKETSEDRISLPLLSVTNSDRDSDCITSLGAVYSDDCRVSREVSTAAFVMLHSRNLTSEGERNENEAEHLVEKQKIDLSVAIDSINNHETGSHERNELRPKSHAEESAVGNGRKRVDDQINCNEKTMACEGESLDRESNRVEVRFDSGRHGQNVINHATENSNVPTERWIQVSKDGNTDTGRLESVRSNGDYALGYKKQLRQQFKIESQRTSTSSDAAALLAEAEINASPRKTDMSTGAQINLNAEIQHRKVSNKEYSPDFEKRQESKERATETDELERHWPSTYNEQVSITDHTERDRQYQAYLSRNHSNFEHMLDRSELYEYDVQSKRRRIEGPNDDLKSSENSSPYSDRRSSNEEGSGIFSPQHVGVIHGAGSNRNIGQDRLPVESMLSNSDHRAWPINEDRSMSQRVVADHTQGYSSSGFYSSHHTSPPSPFLLRNHPPPPLVQPDVGGMQEFSHVPRTNEREEPTRYIGTLPSMWTPTRVKQEPSDNTQPQYSRNASSSSKMSPQERLQSQFLSGLPSPRDEQRWMPQNPLAALERMHMWAQLGAAAASGRTGGMLSGGEARNGNGRIFQSPIPHSQDVTSSSRTPNWSAPKLMSPPFSRPPFFPSSFHSPAERGTTLFSPRGGSLAHVTSSPALSSNLSSRLATGGQIVNMHAIASPSNVDRSPPTGICPPLSTLPPKIFSCHICAYFASSKEEFDAHTATHYTYSCTLCEYKSRTRGRLQRHIKDLHCSNDISPSSLRQQPNGTNLGQSQASRQAQSNAAGQQTGFADSVAMERDAAKGGSKSPEAEHVSFAGSAEVAPVKKLIGSGVTKKPRIFRCLKCDATTTDKEEMWTHRQTHMDSDKQLRCPQCRFVTHLKHHLEYHLRHHYNSKPVSCPKCEYTCINQSMLTSHMKSHSNVYPFRCATVGCNFATKYRHTLQVHLDKTNHPAGYVLNPDGSIPSDRSGGMFLRDEKRRRKGIRRSGIRPRLPTGEVFEGGGEGAGKRFCGGQGSEKDDEGSRRRGEDPQGGMEATMISPRMNSTSNFSSFPPPSSFPRSSEDSYAAAARVAAAALYTTSSSLSRTRAGSGDHPSSSKGIPSLKDWHSQPTDLILAQDSRSGLHVSAEDSEMSIRFGKSVFGGMTSNYHGFGERTSQLSDHFDNHHHGDGIRDARRSSAARYPSDVSIISDYNDSRFMSGTRATRPLTPRQPLPPIGPSFMSPRPVISSSMADSPASPTIRNEGQRRCKACTFVSNSHDDLISHLTAVHGGGAWERGRERIDIEDGNLIGQNRREGPINVAREHGLDGRVERAERIWLTDENLPPMCSPRHLQYPRQPTTLPRATQHRESIPWDLSSRREDSGTSLKTGLSARCAGSPRSGTSPRSLLLKYSPVTHVNPPDNILSPSVLKLRTGKDGDALERSPSADSDWPMVQETGESIAREERAGTSPSTQGSTGGEDRRRIRRRKGVAHKIQSLDQMPPEQLDDLIRYDYDQHIDPSYIDAALQRAIVSTNNRDLGVESAAHETVRSSSSSSSSSTTGPASQASDLAISTSENPQAIPPREVGGNESSWHTGSRESMIQGDDLMEEDYLKKLSSGRVDISRNHQMVTVVSQLMRENGKREAIATSRMESEEAAIDRRAAVVRRLESQFGSPALADSRHLGHHRLRESNSHAQADNNSHRGNRSMGGHDKTLTSVISNICVHCGITFPETLMYAMHMSFHVGGDQGADDDAICDDPFKCAQCGERCADRTEFYLHIARTAHR